MLMTSYDTPFGTGRDGNVTLTTNTVATRDMWYNNLTLNAGVKLNANGYIIRVANVLTLNNGASIHNNGNNGNSIYGSKVLGGAKGTLGGGGAGGANATSTWLPGLPGDSVASNSLGGAGGAGKDGGTSTPGGAGGSVTPVDADMGGNLAVQNQLNPFYNGRSAIGLLYNGGAGGGSSANTSFMGTGGGGGGGGVVVVAAKTITGTAAFIEANGGNGFVGDSPLGGGGGGGSAVVITNSITGTTVRANGGTGFVAGQNGLAVTYLV